MEVARIDPDARLSNIADQDAKDFKIRNGEAIKMLKQMNE